MPMVEPVFNPRLPEFHANPYPFYQALREKDPVHQSPLGFWVFTRYDDVVTSLRDPRYGRDGFAPLIEAVYGPETAEGNLPRRLSLTRSAKDEHPRDGLLGQPTRQLREMRDGPVLRRAESTPCIKADDLLTA